MKNRAKEDKQAPQNPDRRRFIKSILGLGSVIETSAEAKTPAKQDEKFFWADLDTGNIGFPTGLDIPIARPGSVMKLVTASALLEEGALNPNEKVECTGLYQSKFQKFKCPKAHGLLLIEEALALSCNAYFAKVATRLSPGTILGYAEKFYLNKPMAGYPGGSFPNLSQVEDDSLNLALGLNSHLKPSALQLMRVAALIGNDGQIPFLRGTDLADLKGDPCTLPFRMETFKHLKTGMRMASQIGTAKALDPEDKLKLAVKTGTVAHGNKFKSWIIGFFPYDKPKHAFCLFAPVGTSHDSAVPLASKRLLSVDWP